MSNLAGYIRVSGDVQVDAYGKDIQHEAIQNWATLTGHQIVEWFEEDGVSGKTDSGDRPVLATIVHRANEFDGIVMFDPTRIARRSVVQETLLGYLWNNGLTVYTTTTGEMSADEDDPTRILLRQMLAVISEFEHRTIVRKLHAGRRIKSSRGGYVGGTARYGRSVDGTGRAAVFTPNEAEHAVVMKIRRWKRMGYSLREIAARLNEEQVPTKTGKGVWHPQHISRILDRPEI